jgi:hypothetical protein
VPNYAETRGNAGFCFVFFSKEANLRSIFGSPKTEPKKRQAFVGLDLAVVITRLARELLTKAPLELIVRQTALAPKDAWFLTTSSQALLEPDNPQLTN